MGIHYFYGKWVSRLGATVNTTQLPTMTGVEGVLFDLNGLLHKIAQKVYLYGNALEVLGTETYASERQRSLTRNSKQAFNEYARALTTEINHVVRTLKPRQYLFVAVDGVAPVAKISQQRARRYAAAAAGLHGNEDPPVNDFTSSLISPGTTFMVDVDTVIRAWISRAQRVSALPPVVYYSPHTVPGEGEHKMFGMLRDLHRVGGVTQGRGAHVVYGMDSDLLVLGICSPIRNIYLSREDLYQNVNLDALFAEIKRDLTANGRAATAKFDNETLRRDFAVVATLVGNDFVPNSPALLTMTTEQIFLAYRTLTEPLTFLESAKVKGRDVAGINLRSFAAFFSALAGSEPMLLVDAAESELRDQNTRRRRLSPSSALLDAYDQQSRSLNVPRLRSLWYSKIRQVRGDAALAGRTATVEQLKDALGSGANLVLRVITDYVAIISWILRYYTGGGEAVSWLFAYRFLLSPFAMDVATALNPQAIEIIRASSAKGQTPTTLEAVAFWENKLGHSLSPGFVTNDSIKLGGGSPAIAPVHQLLAITPPSRVKQVIGIDLLANLILKGGPLAHIAPSPGEYEMYTEGKTADYLAVPLLPEVNVFQIVDAVKAASEEVAEESMRKNREKFQAALADREPGQRLQLGRMGLKHLVPKRLSYQSYGETDLLTGAYIPPPQNEKQGSERPEERKYAVAGKAFGETDIGRWGVVVPQDAEYDDE